MFVTLLQALALLFPLMVSSGGDGGNDEGLRVRSNTCEDWMKE
jgi:hypothetical protein